jgi:hypothetical protein
MKNLWVGMLLSITVKIHLDTEVLTNE